MSIYITGQRYHPMHQNELEVEEAKAIANNSVQKRARKNRFLSGLIWCCTAKVYVGMLFGVFLSITLLIFAGWIFISFYCSENSSNYTSITEKALCGIQLAHSITKSFTQEPSNNSSYVTDRTCNSVDRTYMLHKPTSFIDTEHRLDVRYINPKLGDSFYREIVEIQKNFEFKSGRGIGPNKIIVAESKISSENEDMLCTLFSSDATEMASTIPLVFSDYVFKPILAFRDLESIFPYRIWYLAESTEVMYTRSLYTLEDIRVIVNDTLLAIDKTRKAGYFVKNFKKLDVFVVTIQQTDKSEKITGAQIFYNENFVKIKDQSIDLNEKYMQNFKGFLRKMISDLSIYFNPEIKIKTCRVRNIRDRIFQIGEISLEMLHFYLLINDFTEKGIKDISDLLDHPFVTGRSIKEPNPYGEWPREEKNGNYTVYKKYVNK